MDLDDAMDVLAQFGAVAGDPNSPPAPPYDEAYDRSAPPAAYPNPGYWRTGPPDGHIVFDDILWVVWQFGHSCFAPP